MSEPTTTERERLQTLLLASAAFARMRSYGLAHTPRNYKVWYVYLSGTLLADTATRLAWTSSALSRRAAV